MEQFTYDEILMISLAIDMRISILQKKYKQWINIEGKEHLAMFASKQLKKCESLKHKIMNIIEKNS